MTRKWVFFYFWQRPMVQWLIQGTEHSQLLCVHSFVGGWGRSAPSSSSLEMSFCKSKCFAFLVVVWVASSSSGENSRWRQLMAMHYTIPCFHIRTLKQQWKSKSDSSSNSPVCHCKHWKRGIAMSLSGPLDWIVNWMLLDAKFIQWQLRMLFSS